LNSTKNKVLFCGLIMAIVVLTLFVIYIITAYSLRDGINRTPDTESIITNPQTSQDSTLSSSDSPELSSLLQFETVSKLRVFHLDKLNINYYILTDDYQLILVKGKVSNVTDPTCPVIKQEDVVMYKTLTLQEESKEYIDLLINHIFKNSFKDFQVFDAETLQVWVGNTTFIEYRLNDTYSPLFEMYDYFEYVFFG